jgi:hypothetical protein
MEGNQITITPKGERNFYDVRASMSVKGTTVDMGPFQPVKLDRFELDTTYSSGEGETGRTFLVTLEHPDGTVLGGPFPCEYVTGKTGVWTLTVEWREDEEPTPPPDDEEDVGFPVGKSMTFTVTITRTS